MLSLKNRVIFILMLSFSAGLGFDLSIDLAESIGVSARGALGVLGYLDESSGTQQWKFQKIDVQGFSIDANIKDMVHVIGSLDYFEDDPNYPEYGEGFQASLSADFTKLNIVVEATGLFGSVGDYKYFFVDAMTSLPIAIGAGPVNITGFGGGVSYHMLPTVDIGNIDFENEPTFTGEIGVSRSGAIYTPDKNIGLGLKASVLIATAKEEVFNGSLTLEFLFNAPESGGGLHQISLLGNGHFLKPLDKSIPPVSKDVQSADAAPMARSAALSAFVKFSYNFTHSTFDGDLAVFLNAGLLTGAGRNNKFVFASMHFSPQDWFINIGTPDDRAGAKLTVPLLGALSIATYLDIGTSIPDFPELPPEVRELAGIVKSNEDIRKSGGGFMFGAEFRAEFKLDVVIASAEFKAILGFDIMLRDYGESMCAGSSEQLGIDGWYAAGQLYAFLEGQLKVFGINVLKAGVAAVFQTRLPNPFWAQANLAFRVKLLFISKTVRANISIGERCVITGGTANENIGLEVVMYTNPVDKSENIETDIKPEIYLGAPIKKNFEIEGDVYRVSDLEIKLSSEAYEIPWREDYNSSEYAFIIIPNEILPANTELTLKTTAIITKNGAFFATEEKEFTFTTGDGFDEIPETNVEYSYPVNGQYDYFKDEYNREEGYIQLISGQPDLIIDEENPVKVKITTASGSEEYVDLNYSALHRKITFPVSSINANELYSLAIVQTGDEERDLYRMYFRSSEYETFKDKLNAISAEVVNPANPVLAGRGGIVANLNQIELFGDVTLQGNHVVDALVRWEADLNNNYYVGNNRMNQLIYDQFPIDDNVCGLISYDNSIKRKDFAGITVRAEEPVIVGVDHFNSGEISFSSNQVIKYLAPTVTLGHLFELKGAISSCINDLSLDMDVGNPDDFVNMILNNIDPEIIDFHERQINSNLVPGDYEIKSTYVLPGNITTSRESVILTKSQ